MAPRSLCILLVEDDEIDAEFFLRCLRRQGSPLEVTVAGNALEALQILRGQPGRPPLAEPYVILLDLGLPGMHGFEFLQELRSDPRLKASKVFVLSGSVSKHDRRRAYEYKVVGYLPKSVFIDYWAPLIKLIECVGILPEVKEQDWLTPTSRPRGEETGTTTGQSSDPLP